MRVSKRVARRLRIKQFASVVIEVFKETGRFNLTEAYRRVHPANRVPAQSAYKLPKEEIMDEVEKMLKLRDPDLLKKIKPDVIVQDIVDDLRKLNEMRDAGQVSVEDMVKILNAKGVKQKLLGLAIGMWKASLTPEKQESAEDLFKQLEKLGGV